MVEPTGIPPIVAGAPAPSSESETTGTAAGGASREAIWSPEAASKSSSFVKRSFPGMTR
jgi:hypothetical protein